MAQPPSTAPDAALELRAPGMGRRILCAAYEFCLLFGVTFITNYLLLSLAQWRWPLDPLRLSILQAYTLCVIGVYFIYFWGRSGQTLAMKTWRIRLVNANGGGIQPLQALLRYLLAWPSLGFFGAGLVWALFDRDGQFLHDRLAGTRLVNSNHA